jgi:hypothetical protein
MKGLEKIKPEQSILTITVGFLVLSEVFKNEAFLIVSIVVGLIGIISTRLSLLLHKGWMKLSQLLSLIVPNIVLALVFYLILTPIALLSRLFNSKGQFQLKNNTSTLFKERNHTFGKKDFEKIW